MKSAEKIVNRWKKAFPLAGFEPVLKAPSDEAQRLAKQFRPLLFADPKLIEEEKADLSKNLGVDGGRGGVLSGFMKRMGGRDFKGVTNALFLFRVGRFPRDLTGGKIGILGVDLPKSELPWDKEMHRVLEQISERLQKEYAEQYLEYLFTFVSCYFFSPFLVYSCFNKSDCPGL